MLFVDLLVCWSVCVLVCWSVCLLVCLSVCLLVSLSVVNGILLYGDRVVIPKGLRQEVLGTLHSSHQGVSSMAGLVGQSVWWPNISWDIVETRARCLECHRNTPSQQLEPPAALPQVRYPFQMMCGDYFALQGHT